MTQQNNNTQKEGAENRRQAIQIPSDILDEKEMILLVEHLKYLKLPGLVENYEAAALKANKESWSCVKYLAQCVS